MESLIIYRPPGSIIISVPIDENTIFRKKLMGENVISAKFTLNDPVEFYIGDYIVYNSEYYFINRLSEYDKRNNKTHDYTIDFESFQYNLAKKYLMSSDLLLDYSLNGTAQDFVSLIVSNMNTIEGGWSMGTIESTDFVTLEFSSEYCLSALTRIAEVFGLEWDIVGKVISMKKSIGHDTTLRFEYGRGLGLYKLNRQQVKDQNIVTRVYGFGGTKNIPYNYKGRAKRLVFDTRFLSKNEDIYGVIEGTYKNDEIYPKRTSTINGAVINFSVTDNSFDYKTSYVQDSTIDFDINNYLIEGQIATIVFKSGDLSSVEPGFEIWKYDNATKRIYFKPYSDADGYTYPQYNSGSPILPVVGDSYTLVNIGLPQAYIDAEEANLKAKTQDYLDENCVPMVVYTVDIDPKYVKRNAINLSVGDRVTAVDTGLGINSLIRVSVLEFPLVNPYKIKATIADFVPYTLQERIVKATISTKQETIYVDRRSAELARRNTMRQNQLMGLIFDTDGYFNGENINPTTIETLLLTVGVKSSNFRLNGVVIEPNYLGDANAIRISAGELIHFQLDVAGGYVWVVEPAAVYNSLTPSSAYYLYAKCSKTSLSGTWDLTTERKLADGTDGYYYFLVGILYAVMGGYRDFDFTYGMTYINGRIITTGRIRSIDGLNYFDLDQNQFMIGNGNSSLDWNVTAPDVLTLKGVLVQNPAGQSYPISVFRGVYISSSQYFKGDTVTYNGGSWIYINDSPSTGNTPVEGAYWTLSSSIGQNGVPGVSIVFKGEYASVSDLIAAQGALQNGWSYRNTTDKKSYVYYGSWYLMASDGQPGSAGTTGPSVVFRGDFNPSTLYYYNLLRRDIVKYSGSYYLFKGVNETSGAWNPANWESFGASFSSVATDILFASLAYIENLGVRFLQTGTSGQRIEIDGTTGTLKFYNAADELVMSLQGGILTAIGANLMQASFVSSLGIGGSAVGIDSGTIKLWDYYDPFFPNSDVGFLVDMDGIKLEQILAANPKFISIHNFTGQGPEATLILNSSYMGFGTGKTEIRHAAVATDVLTVRQINFTRPLTSIEANAAPPYSMYVDSNGAHVVKNGNGTPHVI